MGNIEKKADLIINCLAMFFISPFIGAFVVCFFAVVFGTVLIVFLSLVYFLLKLFFDLDLSSFIHNYNNYFTYAAFLYLLTGVIGGWIWGLLEIKEMVKESRTN